LVIVRGVSSWRLLVSPGAEEQLLQFGYGGALDPERGIAPICFAGVAVGRDFSAGRVFVGDVEVDAAGGCRVGLLLNFNTVALKDGTRRRIV
jgi:hypothetical protein